LAQILLYGFTTRFQDGNSNDSRKLGTFSRRHQMDFDGDKKKGFVNWKYEEKDMKTLRTITAIFTPAIALSFLFSVNVIKLDGIRTSPVLSQTKMELNLVQDESTTWYAQIHRQEMESKALAKR
jgi:hypothetical protein